MPDTLMKFDAMRFSEMYRRAVAYWPKEIAIEDGLKVGKNGFRLSNLYDKFAEAETAAEADNPLVVLTIWCCFQAFHKESKRLCQEGLPVLRIEDVSPAEVEKRVADNLECGDWPLYKDRYENDLKAT
ncbi:MAG: hypothetical protein AAF004_13935 [Pseudomonadota bacterium]